jgi:hypothetical protein
MVYESPPWTLDWLAELNEMKKKGDASPTDAADKATTKPVKKKSKNLDKIFDDVDTDDEGSETDPE